MKENVKTFISQSGKTTWELRKNNISSPVPVWDIFCNGKKTKNSLSDPLEEKEITTIDEDLEITSKGGYKHTYSSSLGS